MGVLSDLEPKRVFEIFEELCAIPHGSTHTKAISDWCVEFGKQLGLEHYQDTANNVILIAPATPGYENAPAVIMQGHLDMVCEKEPGGAKDMDTEGLDLFVEGDVVGARGTTLGSDDGIAVAMALAALEDKEMPHPRLEAVLTTEEEIGMLGAAVLDVSPLQGRTMLNIDSEVEGVFTVGCAGGSRVSCRLPLRREAFDGETLMIRVGGLVGGHSGVEIDKGRANADMVLGRLLKAASGAAEVRLVSAQGGSKDNAIPTAAEAVLVTADGGAVRAAVERLTADLKKEYRAADPGLTVTVEPGEACWLPMDADTTKKAVCLLFCLPNGIQGIDDALSQGAFRNCLRVHAERHAIQFKGDGCPIPFHGQTIQGLRFVQRESQGSLLHPCQLSLDVHILIAHIGIAGKAGHRRRLLCLRF